MADRNCEALDALLLEYIERFGLTQSARQYFSDLAEAEGDKGLPGNQFSYQPGSS